MLYLYINPIRDAARKKGGSALIKKAKRTSKINNVMGHLVRLQRMQRVQR